MLYLSDISPSAHPNIPPFYQYLCFSRQDYAIHIDVNLVSPLKNETRIISMKHPLLSDLDWTADPFVLFRHGHEAEVRKEQGICEEGQSPLKAGEGGGCGEKTEKGKWCHRTSLGDIAHCLLLPSTRAVSVPRCASLSLLPSPNSLLLEGGHSLKKTTTKRL